MISSLGRLNLLMRTDLMNAGPSHNHNGSHPHHFKPVAAFEKNRRWFPPIVHPEHLSAAPKRLLRKRKVDTSSITYSPSSLLPVGYGNAVLPQQPEVVQVMTAHQARKARRMKRAKSQAINLVGGGDKSHIERQAVFDSDYTRLLSPSVKIASLEQALIHDFAIGFEPKMFVEMTFGHVYDTLIEASRTAKDVEAVPATTSEPEDPISPLPSQAVTDSKIAMPEELSRNSKSISNGSNNAQESADIVIVPPSTKPTKDKNNLKTLPSGKDPESRRLRRLMRNRLSAQASRDRRQKAIEDLRKLKTEKEGEIALLDQFVSQELDHMMHLEKALSFAQDTLVLNVTQLLPDKRPWSKKYTKAMIEF